MTGPWTAAMLPQLAFTQSADTLLLCHPDMVPQRVTRTSHTAWTVAPWSFPREPFYRFADATLAASATTGTVTLTASAAVFQPGHAGVRFRLGGKRLLVTAVASATQATATVEETLAGTAATTDWEEAAFSAVRGWPVTLCFHQDRLVLGGSRDLPNRLWLSRTGDLFNFDLGTGLDDQAIEFGVVSDQVNAIRGVFSGQHLQVFTSGAEWMVIGRAADAGQHPAQPADPRRLAGGAAGAAGGCRRLDHLRRPHRARRVRVHLYRPAAAVPGERPGAGLAAPGAGPGGDDLRPAPPPAARGDGRRHPGDADAVPRRAGHRLDPAGDGWLRPLARRHRRQRSGPWWSAPARRGSNASTMRWRSTPR